MPADASQQLTQEFTTMLSDYKNQTRFFSHEKSLRLLEYIENTVFPLLSQLFIAEETMLFDNPHLWLLKALREAILFTTVAAVLSVTKGYQQLSDIANFVFQKLSISTPFQTKFIEAFKQNRYEEGRRKHVEQIQETNPNAPNSSIVISLDDDQDYMDVQRCYPNEWSRILDNVKLFKMIAENQLELIRSGPDNCGCPIIIKAIEQQDAAFKGDYIHLVNTLTTQIYDVYNTGITNPLAEHALEGIRNDIEFFIEKASTKASNFSSSSPSQYSAPVGKEEQVIS